MCEVLTVLMSFLAQLLGSDSDFLHVKFAFEESSSAHFDDVTAADMARPLALIETSLLPLVNCIMSAVTYAMIGFFPMKTVLEGIPL